MGLKMHDISPVAAMISGKGGMGKAMRQGFGGIGPMMIARSGYDKSEEERQAQEQERAAASKQAAAQGMKKGGVVGSASKRADGCAVKGKTRGKMV
jgi:hypothetical protein